MPPITEHSGVKFDEAHPANFILIVRIETTLNSGFGQDQLKSLRDVKEVMAQRAKASGGSYIADFRYGQRNGSILDQLWSLDNVLWFGAGNLGYLNTQAN